MGSEIEEDESSNFDQLIQNKILPTTVRLMNNFVDDKNEKVSKPNKGYTIFTREEVEDVCIICLNNFDDCSHFQVDLLDQKLNEEKNIHSAHNSQQRYNVLEKFPTGDFFCGVIFSYVGRFAF